LRLWLDLIIGSTKCKERKMNREESPKFWLEVLPDYRRHKLTMLKKAITEAAYKVKVEDIAEKFLKERLFELALIFCNHKYQKCGDN
jgi:hypothetical protein